MKPALVAISLISLVLGGCSGSSTITKEDLSFLYDRNTTKLRVPARVHHLSTEKSELHYKLHTEDLLYRRGGEGDPFAALVRIHFETFDAADRKLLIDSGTVFVSDLSENSAQEKELIGSLSLKRIPEKDVLVLLTAHDLYRDIQSVRRLEVPKAQTANRQDFLLLDAETNIPYFTDRPTPSRAMKVFCPQCRDTEITGSFHPLRSELPRPVFSPSNGNNQVQSADSMFVLRFDEQGFAKFDPKRKGIYHLRPDSSLENGLSVVILGDSYPTIRTVDDMIGPLRYITSETEYNAILTSTNKRRAVEALWLDLAGDKTKARDVIRAYYRRVENANMFFSGLKEGWKTDRGLVHIIFGIPNTIHKNAGSETWIYGDETSLLSMQFVFLKQNEMFTDNDMRLDRDPSFRSAWYRNVESWRNGRIQTQ